jgi:large subunit ribosomal protein L21
LRSDWRCGTHGPHALSAKPISLGESGSRSQLLTPTPGFCRMPGFSTQLTRQVTMYAVVKTGGKQYRVSAGEKLKVEQIPADIGAEIVLDQVLLVSNGDNLTMGAPVVSGASVTAKVLAHGRGEKVRIFKMRRRKHYRKSQGHRQNYTEIEIVGITEAQHGA